MGVYFFCYAQDTETIKKEKEKEINSVFFAPLAQPVEHRTFNPLVLGSNPRGRTPKKTQNMSDRRGYFQQKVMKNTITAIATLQNFFLKMAFTSDRFIH